VRLAIGHIESLFARSQIAEVRFNAGLDQPAYHLGEDQLARLRLCQNLVYPLGIHNFSFTQLESCVGNPLWLLSSLTAGTGWLSFAHGFNLLGNCFYGNYFLMIAALH
jgi:hypothetical protein